MKHELVIACFGGMRRLFFLVTFGGPDDGFRSFPSNCEWPTSIVIRKSGYGQGDGLGDNGDDWKVICSAKYWRRESKVYFQHVDSGKFLR